MIWVAASVFAIGIIYFSLHYPKFRKAVVLAVGCLAVLLGGVALYIWYDANQNERKAEIARKLISENQIAISDATLSLGPLKELQASVTNNSAFTLTSLSLRVSVTDCPKVDDLVAKDPKCNIVGQDTASDGSINIPPGQKRKFSAYASFSNLPDLQAGGWSWSYTIAEIRGEPPP